MVQNDIVSKCNDGHFSAELDSIFLDRERGIKKKSAAENVMFSNLSKWLF